MADQGTRARPFEFRAPLGVCVDVKHPLSYLALGPVRDLAAELGVGVDWLPFPAPPMKPPPEAANDRGTRHRLARARYQEADIERYARDRGLTVRGLYRSPDSTRASLGLLWLRDRAPARSADYLERVCAGYWSQELDLQDAAALGRVIEALGEDPEAFAAFADGPGAEALPEVRARLVDAGVFTVPSLVVEGEVFVGRAHLPMVRWVLTGRAGPPPV